MPYIFHVRAGDRQSRARTEMEEPLCSTVKILTDGWLDGPPYHLSPVARPRRAWPFGENELKLLLEDKIGPFGIEMAVAAVRLNYLGALRYVLDRSSFTREEVCFLAMASVDNVDALKILLSEYEWLARTHVDDEIGLLSYVIIFNKKKLKAILDIPQVKENLDVEDIWGHTPVLKAARRKDRTSFFLLVDSGAVLPRTPCYGG